MKLEIQNLIFEYGLEQVVKEYKLIYRDYGHKFLLKYNQYESDLTLRAVQECRGLILNAKNGDVMSYGFKKFFNAAENSAAHIDWKTATVLEKLDGSFIQLYWDSVLDKWCAGTSGTADGSGNVGDHNITFSELFFQILEEKNIPWPMFDPNYCFIFELTSPKNIVVKQHTENNVTLIGARDIRTLEELNYEELCDVAAQTDLDVPIAFDFISRDDIEAIMENLDADDEGYVVVDKDFDRIKIKNPAYVAAHYTRTSQSRSVVINVIRQNEMDEYLSYFPGRREELLNLEAKYYELIDYYEVMCNVLAGIEFPSQKDVAEYIAELVETNVAEQEWTGLLFSVHAGKVKDAKTYIDKQPEKKMYDYLLTAII